jgi:uncharacterized C2H2 Zn-finger protein
MKDALNEDNALIEAGPDGPEQAKCPACEGTVVLRSRRYGRGSKKTWFYRHRRGEGPWCSRRSGPVRPVTSS